MKLFEFIRNKHEIIFKLLLFLVALGIIVWIFPNRGKFKYEFQKGKLWEHQTLYAPFDFALYKSTKEVNQEKAQIEKDSKSYFVIDTTVEEKAINNYKMLFNKNWNDSIAVKKLKAENIIIPLLGIGSGKIIKVKDSTLNQGVKLLKTVFNKGIIELNNVGGNFITDSSNIMLLRNNIAEEHPISDFYTLQSAFNYIKQEASKTGFVAKEFLLDNIESVLNQNIIYDASITKKVFNSRMQQVSLTEGKVQEGERIISTGNLIDGKKYQELVSFKKEYMKRIEGQSSNILLSGQVLIVALIFLVLFLFIREFKEDILDDDYNISFILLMIVIMVIATETILKVGKLNFYLVPFCILPLIVRTFYNSRIALFVHLCAISIIGFIVPNAFDFFILQFVSGCIAIFSITQLRKRSELFLSVLIIFGAYTVTYIGIGILQEGNIVGIDWSRLGWFAGSALLTLLAHPLIYLFEKMFGFVSEITFMELSDTNNELLRELNFKAPGTFQHSMQVANLAEEAIREIGGNPHMTRAGALYHDIGKMYKPLYFVENQTTQINPHNDLSYIESAEIIIQHVIKGIELARRHNIPDQIIDFIRTHHGTTFTRYFYTMYKNEHPDEEIDESEFRYPGPIPYSKETAVLMMADSVEAASRSLKKYNEESISSFVENIIDSQISENQFVNANITFREIQQIKNIFKKRLMNIYHIRIAYPKEIK